MSGGRQTRQSDAGVGASVHITAADTGTARRKNAVWVRFVTVCTKASGGASVLTLYDSPSAAANPIATIDCTDHAGTYTIETNCGNGLWTVMTAAGAAGDIIIG